MKTDFLIVGAGLFGSVVAERLSTQLHKQVTIVEKRPFVGGNCHSRIDAETGIEIHRFGTHIFHTSSRRVMEYIGGFCELNGYHHQVLAMQANRVVQMPINLETICSIYGRTLTPREGRELIAEETARECIAAPANLEELALATVGRKIYEALIKGYTQKQWGTSPRKLPVEILARIPVRYDYSEDYFHHARWQGIPLGGYAELFAGLLASPLIRTCLEQDYFLCRSEIEVTQATIYTGPIDRYFAYRHGHLGWRSLRFEFQHHDTGDYQGCAVMNCPDEEIPHTRIHEFRHLHPERTYRHDKTIIAFEYPTVALDEPYYPLNDRENQERFACYERLTQSEANTYFGGRLGSYRYLDMDQTILAALDLFDELKRRFI